MKPLSGFGNTVVISHYYCDQLHIFYDVNKKCKSYFVPSITNVVICSKTEDEKKMTFCVTRSPTRLQKFTIGKGK